MSISNPQTVPAALADFDIKHYLGVVRRRRLPIVLTTVGLFFFAMVFARGLPNLYRAETVILVDAQQVPANYVPTTVTTSVQDRLSTIQQQVMSPTRLMSMIDRLNLFPKLRGKISDEELIHRIQGSTRIEVSARGGSFKIGYQGENPEQAAKIANDLAETFIGENLKTREQQFVGTAEFLDAELQETKKNLEAREKELQTIKRRDVLDLPESKGYHLETLNNLRMQLQASQDRVNRAQQSKVLLQSMVAPPPTIDLDEGATGAASKPSGQQKEIEKLEAHLAELQTRYGPNFPDVRKTQGELDRLRKKAAAETAQTPAAAPVEAVVADPKSKKKNPVVDAQVNKLDEEIAEQVKLQASLQQQIEFHMSKLERVPVFEQQIAGLLRDYDSLRAHYQSLLDKKLSAEMATQLEVRQKGERFVILDSARPPSRPSGPNRLLISMAGLVIGLFGGLGLALLIEVMDPTVRGEEEAAKLFCHPVLGEIPQLRSEMQLRAERIRFAISAVITAALSAGVGLVISIVSRKLGIF
jgi:polysaccharide chain length determinant protein (PEP-CTERM system associated)